MQSASRFGKVKIISGAVAALLLVIAAAFLTYIAVHWSGSTPMVAPPVVDHHAEDEALAKVFPAEQIPPPSSEPIVVDSSFECATRVNAQVDGNHVQITLMPGQLDWWMFRLKGVAGKPLTIDIISPRASLRHWVTLTPVYSYATDLNNPAVYSTGAMDVVTAHNEEHVAIPDTSGQQWHYFRDCRLTKEKTFTITKTFAANNVFIAGRVPYTPQYSEKMLLALNGNPNANLIVVGSTEEERPIEILKIGGGDDALERSKPCILLCGGEQAFQQDGMWACQGCIEFLLGDSAEAKALRNRFVFLIIPMLDPDGTARSRMGLFFPVHRGGFENPTCIAYANWLQKRMLSGKRVDLVIELHSLQSHECEHLMHIEMSDLPDGRAQLVAAFHSLLTQQFESSGLRVSAEPMDGGPHNARRFAGWVSERLGAMDVLYEVNSQAPSRHLSLAQLKDLGRLFALTSGRFLDSVNGQRLLASVDRARAARMAAWNGNPATRPDMDAIESSEIVSETMNGKQ